MKDDLLRQAEDDFAALRRGLVGLDDEAMRRPWLGVWGVREILAHIAGWHREMTPVLERLARGERPIPEGVSYEDFDGWNARHVSARRGLTVAGIRAGARDVPPRVPRRRPRRPRVPVRAGQNRDAHRGSERPASLPGARGPDPHLASRRRSVARPAAHATIGAPGARACGREPGRRARPTPPPTTAPRRS